MYDTRHVAEGVDESVARRGLEADDELLAAEDALARRDEHPVLREVERELSHQPKVVLTHDLTIEAHVTPECSSRYLHPATICAGDRLAQFLATQSASATSMYVPTRSRRQ